MATLSNNRISFTMDEQNLADIKTAFVSINNAMSFLISLRADERSSLPKMSVVNKQFVQDAFNAISNNAQLFPSYINSEELRKDLKLYDQLDELVTLSMQLSEKMRDTQILAGSEAYVSGLSIYRLIEAASKAGVPGADTIYDQLAERFAQNSSAASVVVEVK